LGLRFWLPGSEIRIARGSGNKPPNYRRISRFLTGPIGGGNLKKRKSREIENERIPKRSKTANGRIIGKNVGGGGPCQTATGNKLKTKGGEKGGSFPMQSREGSW